jgi:hypothetical protein
MATDTNKTEATMASKIVKWNGYTVLMGGTDAQARILGYMWDAQQRQNGGNR